MNTTLPQILEDALEVKEMNFDLERMRLFDATLGYPSCQFASVHIAGTNGKGSVATKIASAFPEKKVGLLTSPHIQTYRERIQINGELIGEKRGEALLKQIVATLPLSPTYFELLTLLAFTYFAEELVDLAVIEVGLGGRLDATNIIRPLLSVITSIGLDHTRYLGETLEKIAYEKGGIIKPGVPVVVGPRACYFPGSIEVTGSFNHYEEENQAIAREALKILGVEETDLSDVPPCRFEQIGSIILDVAHNPAALKCLFERISLTFPGKKVRAFIAFSKDKAIGDCLKIVQAYTTAYHFIRVDHPRISNPQEACSFEEAFAFAQDDELLVICGTFFMMADAKAIIKKEFETY